MCTRKPKTEPKHTKNALSKCLFLTALPNFQLVGFVCVCVSYFALQNPLSKINFKVIH